MIPSRDITFLKPDSAREAVLAWQDSRQEGAGPLYFGGGTEIVTLARENKLRADRFIACRTLPEVGLHSPGYPSGVPGEEGREEGGLLVWGSGLRLNEVADRGMSLLLGLCCNGVADRTVRNSITLGGNICGMLPYREAVLPFLLLQGQVESLSGPDTREMYPLPERFSKRLGLAEGELVLSFCLEQALVAAVESRGVIRQEEEPCRISALARGGRGGWFYERRTAGGPVDYPLSTLVLVQIDGEYRLALTGVFGYPLRALRAEALLNGPRPEGLPAPETTPAQAVSPESDGWEALAGAALDAEGLKYKTDLRGSGPYRRAVAVQSLARGLAELDSLTGSPGPVGPGIGRDS
ncbi:FAD binding domain-containing protein [Alkalispirochaeta alkalica]|uniref:FAD binding domain-containing protein n=1 Tax=Alkalispirochaeta alkalica TaxID=46356 RepID=UPI000367373E|nr:FAD binding domain-containing protein [Alkalispirochaeta alkalica]